MDNVSVVLRTHRRMSVLFPLFLKHLNVRDTNPSLLCPVGVVKVSLCVATSSRL